MSYEKSYSSGSGGANKGGQDRQNHSNSRELKYFKGSGVPMDILIRDYVQAIGKEIADSETATSQIRAFYDEVLRLNELAKKEANFSKLRPSIYLLSSKAAYSKGRKTIGEYLMMFIQQNINLIETQHDLADFALYFEAVYGYYKFASTNRGQGGKR